MKLSAQMMLVIASMFSVLCLGYAFYGWWSLGDVPPEQLADARGFVGFWVFLGAVGVVSAIVSWRMTKGSE